MPQVQTIPEGAIFGRIASIPIKQEMRKRRAGFDHQAVHPAAGKFRKHFAPTGSKVTRAQVHDLDMRERCNCRLFHKGKYE